MLAIYKPGAGGAIGWTEVINSKPDGYKLAVLTVELLTLPHLGLAKFNYDDFQPIAQLNADPAAITVKDSNDSFRSGGRMRMPMRSHSATCSAIFSVSPESAERSAAM